MRRAREGKIEEEKKKRKGNVFGWKRGDTQREREMRVKQILYENEPRKNKLFIQSADQKKIMVVLIKILENLHIHDKISSLVKVE